MLVVLVLLFYISPDLLELQIELLLHRDRQILRLLGLLETNFLQRFEVIEEALEPVLQLVHLDTTLPIGILVAFISRLHELQKTVNFVAA